MGTDTILNNLCEITYLILTTVPRRRYDCFPNFRDKETETHIEVAYSYVITESQGWGGTEAGQLQNWTQSHYVLLPY